MIKLEAPLPAVQTISILPDPQSNDSEALLHRVDTKRAMDGTKYTYVNQVDRRRLTYEFRLTRMKALELRAFIQSYFDSEIKLTNHKDEVWHLKFVNNPFEFSTAGRAAGSPGGEIQSIQLQFEGVKQ
jgi:hypothetical protein